MERSQPIGNDDSLKWYSASFMTNLVLDVLLYEVRFLCGFFDCAPRCLQSLCERMGCCEGDKPFFAQFAATEDPSVGSAAEQVVRPMGEL